jgi:hypothetical protein
MNGIFVPINGVLTSVNGILCVGKGVCVTVTCLGDWMRAHHGEWRPSG